MSRYFLPALKMQENYASVGYNGTSMLLFAEK
jgi:hypothetical protein